jgi:hypothetical protein
MTLSEPVDPPDRARVLLATSEPEHDVPAKTLKVTEPVGLNPPEIVAVSETGVPTVALKTERVVVTVGAALLTLRVSEPQRLSAGALFESPLYDACQSYEPLAVNVTATGPAVPDVDNATVWVANIVPEQPVPE